jgi:oligopeptide/dipeptide ABC transporter ATP-binding protein
MSADPIIRISGLSASYATRGGTVAAVRNVSLDLRRGEVLALVGESGCGKTTLGLSILQLLPEGAELAGEIVYDGRVLSGLKGEALRRIRGAEIAMIFQEPQSALTPTITVGDQVAELFQSHRALGESEALAAAVDTLSKVLPDPVHVAGLYPFQLSGGMAQRVLIAMAMALEPSVIIADEATSSLDGGVREETLVWLEELRDGGEVAVLLITHDFGVVARLADRVVVMYAGEVLERAEVRTLFRQPRHPYTAGLLASVRGVATGGGRLPALRGQPPDLSSLPPECPFLPRCGNAVPRCRTDVAPGLGQIAPGQWVACYSPVPAAVDV